MSDVDSILTDIGSPTSAHQIISKYLSISKKIMQYKYILQQSSLEVILLLLVLLVLILLLIF